MRFENVNGIQHIILNESDKVSITTESELKKMSIDIECENDRLNISGNSSLVNKISGDGMLDKVFIQPTLSSNEIIEKCDQWLEMFRKVHDKFGVLVLSNKYRQLNVTMELSFNDFFISDKSLKGKTIELNLKQLDTIIQEGVTISVDDNNETIYKYILANVLEHYLSVNYAYSIVNTYDFSWNHILYSNFKRQDKSTVPALCNLNKFYESSEYSRIITSIIANHNLGQNSKQIITSLRNAIYNQQLSEKFNRSIDYSNLQFDCIMSDIEPKIISLKK